MTGSALMLPTPSRRSVFPDGAASLHPTMPNGGTLHSWIQGNGFVLGSTCDEIVLVEADASREKGQRSSGIVAYIRLPEGNLRNNFNEEMFQGAQEIKGPNIRNAWLELCWLAAERFPQSASDIIRFMSSELERFELADTYFALPDVSVVDDCDVEQRIDINHFFSVSRLLFYLHIKDDMTTAVIHDGIAYIGDIYKIRRPGAPESRIREVRKTWTLDVPWTRERRILSTLEEAFAIYTKEALSVGAEDLSGHDKLDYYEDLNDAIETIGAAGGLSNLFLPRL